MRSSNHSYFFPARVDTTGLAARWLREEHETEQLGSMPHDARRQYLLMRRLQQARHDRKAGRA